MSSHEHRYFLIGCIPLFSPKGFCSAQQYLKPICSLCSSQP
uniref:Uncharacterized protein n=1 Tax=Arundo donax TaxID=35708 RepID=A0A0A9FAN5_ARUDO